MAALARSSVPPGRLLAFHNQLCAVCSVLVWSSRGKDLYSLVSEDAGNNKNAKRPASAARQEESQWHPDRLLPLLHVRPPELSHIAIRHAEAVRVASCQLLRDAAHQLRHEGAVGDRLPQLPDNRLRVPLDDVHSDRVLYALIAQLLPHSTVAVCE
jgi:hypothetical protein